MSDDEFDGSANPTPDEVVTAWLRRVTLRTEEDFWAWDYVREAGPNEKWRLTRRLVDQAPDEVLGFIGAGPLEELVYAAGQWMKSGQDDWVRVIEMEARSNDRLRQALENVWPEPDDPDELWQRLDAVIGSGISDRHPRLRMSAEERARWVEADERARRMRGALHVEGPPYEPPEARGT